MKTLLISAMISLMPWISVGAQTCARQSPAHTVALMELYTSEGCSSCPPADRYVSNLRRDAGSGLDLDHVIPLSLHVDYWDYIGWKDVYAKSDFTKRQQWLSTLANSSTVYTPEVFLGGKELRSWSNGLQSAVAKVNAIPARANIGLSATNTGKSLQVQLTAQAAQDSRVWLALYQNDISSVIKAGENGGATLHHDYVVREWVNPASLSASNKNASVTQTFNIPAGVDPRSLGVVALVQSERGEVLQALALPLCTR